MPQRTKGGDQSSLSAAFNYFDNTPCLVVVVVLEGQEAYNFKHVTFSLCFLTLVTPHYQVP